MGKGKITREQLSENLLGYIMNNAGGSSVVFKKNNVKVQSETNRVVIGVQGFVKSVDLLLVYKNSVYLEENEDYTISEDGLYIQKIEGTWNPTGVSSFNFIVIKGKTAGSDSGSGGIYPGGNGEVTNGSITEEKLSVELKEKINGPKTWNWLRGI